MYRVWSENPSGNAKSFCVKDFFGKNTRPMFKGFLVKKRPIRAAHPRLP